MSGAAVKSGGRFAAVMSLETNDKYFSRLNGTLLA
jgi:hypothetical protein